MTTQIIIDAPKFNGVYSGCSLFDLNYCIFFQSKSSLCHDFGCMGRASFLLYASFFTSKCVKYSKAHGEARSNWQEKL